MDNDIVILDYPSLIKYTTYDTKLTIRIHKIYKEMRKRDKANKRMLFINKLK